MEQPQESRPESGKNEGAKAAKNSGGVIPRLLRKGTLLIAGLFGAAGGAAGCGGARTEAPPTSLLDVRVTMVAPVEKARPPEGGTGGGAKKEEKKEGEKGDIETRRVAVIGQGHVKVDGRYYLKTKDWDKEAVWVLHKGYRLPALDTPSEISAEFQGKNMKYASRYYSEAEDPTAWEKGVKAAENGEALPRVPEKMETTKKIEEIPPAIRMLLGENAVRLQNPATVQCGRDIFLVDSDGRRLWKFIAGDTRFLLRGTVDRPFINGGVVYGTRATVKYGEEIKEQITTHDMRIGPNGQPFVDPHFIRVWQLADVTLDALRTRVEEDAAHARAAAREKRERQIEQEKHDAVRAQGRFLKIVRISGKTFEDSRGVVWTHAAGYFPSLSPGMIYGAKVRMENPQWERNPRGAGYSLVGGTQILRWRVDGSGDVEFRAPVERRK